MSALPRAGLPRSSPVTAAFGLAIIVWLLALGAAVPGVGFLVLGYLLVVEGRVARGQSLREAFPLLRQAPRAGVALAIGWCWVLPIRLLWAATLDARVIAADGRAPKVLLALTVGGGILVALHLAVAVLRGAPLRSLLWPPGNVRWLVTQAAAPKLGALWLELALPRLLWLGLRGFFGALLWLALPAALWIAARAGEAPRPGLALLGGLALIPVLAWLPFLQAQLAVSSRWRALFEWRSVREHFRRAPVAFLVALILTYALTLPLYLLKVVLPPRDAAWIVTLVFVGTVLPVRLLVAWAWRRAMRRAAPASAWIVWPVRVVIVAFLAAYAVLLFLAPLVDTHGNAALLSHHAFLLPSPF